MQFEADWIRKWARYSPDAVALKDADSGVSYTYGLLFKQSCILARHLREQEGICAGDRVAVLIQNEIDYVPLFLSLQRLGAIMVPINFRLTAPEVQHILEDCTPKLLVYQTAFSDLLEKIPANVRPPELALMSQYNQLIAETAANYDPAAERLAIHRDSPDWLEPMQVTEDQPCKILYTSGTTGFPKGAIVTHKMLFWNSVNTSLRLNIAQDDVSISFLPFFHTGGWNVLLTPFLHRGGKTIFIKKFEPARILQLCESEQVTILFGVPTTMDMMAATPEFERCQLASIRYAVVGGEPMPVELIRTWEGKGIPVRQGYGLTEFGPNVFSLNAEDSLRKIGSIGFPNFYIDVNVVNEAGQAVVPGEIGELVLRGPVCTPGYWNNPKATAEAIRDGWLHTGDLVRQDDEGYFYVAGRKKDMFISGGENVYPVEIERLLSTHPAVREVAVIGVPDEKWGEVGKAYIALHAGRTTDGAELLNFCQANLAKYKIPKHFQFLPELPKGDSGKLLKRKLRDLD